MAILLLGVALPAQAAPPLSGTYSAIVTRVIDGDTFEARIHIWLGQEALTRVRLKGIDAPELRGKCPGEQKAAQAAREHLTSLLSDGFVFLTEIEADKYGDRIVAHARLPSGEDVAAQMLAVGHAKPMAKSRAKWC
jgi:endonuclease YncB( thermonuclease family)